MNEDKLSEADGCSRVSVINSARRHCRLVRARCATSSCVSICSKTFLVVVNFVFLVSPFSSLLAHALLSFKRLLLSVDVRVCPSDCLSATLMLNISKNKRFTGYCPIGSLY